MKRLINLFLLLLVVSGSSFAQGIAFQHIGFEEALAKAKQEDKLVFIDFYTDWCGPCKQMAKYTFTDPAVGEYYNKHFINLKLDAEKEGRPQAQKYGVSSYPTTIFLDGKGNVVIKQSGSKNANTLLKMGRSAIDAKNSGWGIDDMKSEYPNRLNDEEFLKIYATKLQENKESPIDAIEAWLKVQTEIKEADVDMMEFLLKNINNLICGGKAEEIYLTNLEEYFDIATSTERSKLRLLHIGMVKATRSEAFRKNSPELMRTFINAFNSLPEKYISYMRETDDNGTYDDPTTFELDYLTLANDDEGYKKLATHYLDSLVSAKTLTQIREDDAALLKDYKENKFRPSLQANITIRMYEAGVTAVMQSKNIEMVGQQYLNRCAKKNADYKKLHQWLDYGEKLLPNVYRIDNLRGDVYAKQGKIKEAIKYKEQALAKIPEKDRRRPQIVKDIEKLNTQK